MVAFPPCPREALAAAEAACGGRVELKELTNRRGSAVWKASGPAGVVAVTPGRVPRPGSKPAGHSILDRREVLVMAGMAGMAELKALVVYESFFGNTESIARAIASGLRLEGLDAEAVDIADYVAEGGVAVDPTAYDLVVVGGPTHAFALSRPATRDDAAARGGDDRYAARGLREWLTSLPRTSGTHLAAAFDTRVSKVRHLPMSASRSIPARAASTATTSPPGLTAH